MLKYVVVDKQTGSVFLNDEAASSGLRTFTMNMDDRYVEIRTYNMRIRMMAVDSETASVR